jgi:hypothetical protein
MEDKGEGRWGGGGRLALRLFKKIKNLDNGDE